MHTIEHRYFTTPIYYANGEPHAGHIYATILGRILKYHYLHRGAHVRFLTGLDEHGEAVANKAKSLGLDPQIHVDAMVEKWTMEFRKFHVDYDIFLRTSSTEHKTNVQNILNHCYQKGDIYFGSHEGYYCLNCEGFLNANEMSSDHVCLVHKKPTQLRKESNYFFNVTKYKNTLKEMISKRQIVTQEKYVNELLGILEQLDGDLSISRPKSRLTWGIELPFDTDHVTYVWFDALPNYVTGVGGFEAARQSPYWAHACHILGKDILKFHGIFWPAMCLSMEIPVPKLFVTGWLLMDGHKMSKSLGNVITPEHILEYGQDAFINYVYRVINPGDDVDISWKSYFERYNADLANGIGNLLSRTLAMCEKYCGGLIPAFHTDQLTEGQKELVCYAESLPAKVAEAFDDLRIADALQGVWSLIAKTDKYISYEKPWELAKENSPKQQPHLENTLAVACGALKTVGYLGACFFPKTMISLLESLWEDTSQVDQFFSKACDFFAVASGQKILKIPKLYERLDVGTLLEKQKKTQPVPAQIPTAPPQLEGGSNLSLKPPISVEHFDQVQLCAATVTQAELVPDSKKLLKLMVSLNDGRERQIFSGIRAWVKPEEIVNRKVLVVGNLAPRQMKFGVSEGMLLTAETVDGKIMPVYLDQNVQEGSQIK